MRNKISVKLALYFLITILVFSAVIGSIFTVWFRSHTINIYKENLMERAERISEIFGPFVAEGTGIRGYGSYTRLINEIAMAEVWLVDMNRELITFPYKGYGMGNVQYSSLPDDAEQVISQVLSGEKGTSENFSSIYDSPTITAGTPLYNEKGGVIGAVLIHSPVSGTDEAVEKGILIYALSTVVGLFLSVILGILFSLIFTKPLKKMNHVAMELTEGNYQVSTDIKQRDEMGMLGESLNVLASRLMEASEQSMKLEAMRKDFIANVSHELKTPVTVVKASAEALIDGIIEKQDEKDRAYRQILAESISLERLIMDLLELSKLQNPDFRLSFDDLDMNSLLEDVMRSSKKLAEKAGMEILADISPQTTIFSGDYNRLRQMIMTAIDNAIKFSEKPSVIYFRAYIENGLKISVKDNGRGIPPEDMPYLFDRFFKRDEGNEGGTGLGLSIAKQIADRHNIAIRIDSTPGTGTEVLFIFPV
jgi:signal transduction histidine kinase